MRRVVLADIDLIQTRDDEAPRLLEAWGNVEELSFESFFSDNTGTLLPDKLPKLRWLSLPNTRDITGVTVRALLDNLPPGQLEFIDLTGCRHVSPDAVEWARSKGVRVKCSSGDSCTGRKIRWG